MKVYFAPFYESNPYQTRLAKALASRSVEVKFVNGKVSSLYRIARSKDVKIIHFHWTEPYYLSDNFFLTLFKSMLFVFWLKRYGKKFKIVWTVHNLLSHSRKFQFIENVILKLFVAQVDAFSVHNKYTISQLVNNFGAEVRRMNLIQHSNYVNEYHLSSGEVPSSYLSSIHNNNVVFMSLGYIRPYKGVGDLVKSFLNVPNPNAKLIIAGKISGNDDEELLKGLIGSDERIILIPGFVDDNMMASYLKLADVMVYPYKDILTSGSLFLGMSYEKCCIAANIGSMPEFLDESYLYSSSMELTSLINRLSLTDKTELRKMGKKNFLVVQPHDWNSMAEKTVEIYRKLIEL